MSTMQRVSLVTGRFGGELESAINAEIEFWSATNWRLAQISAFSGGVVDRSFELFAILTFEKETT